MSATLAQVMSAVESATSELVEDLDGIIDASFDPASNILSFTVDPLTGENGPTFRFLLIDPVPSTVYEPCDHCGDTDHPESACPAHEWTQSTKEN